MQRSARKNYRTRRVDRAGECGDAARYPAPHGRALEKSAGFRHPHPLLRADPLCIRGDMVHERGEHVGGAIRYPHCHRNDGGRADLHPRRPFFRPHGTEAFRGHRLLFLYAFSSAVVFHQKLGDADDCLYCARLERVRRADPKSDDCGTLFSPSAGMHGRRLLFHARFRNSFRRVFGRLAVARQPRAEFVGSGGVRSDRDSDVYDFWKRDKIMTSHCPVQYLIPIQPRQDIALQYPHRPAFFRLVEGKRLCRFVVVIELGEHEFAVTRNDGA